MPCGARPRHSSHRDLSGPARADRTPPRAPPAHRSCMRHRATSTRSARAGGRRKGCSLRLDVRRLSGGGATLTPLFAPSLYTGQQRHAVLVRRALRDGDEGRLHGLCLRGLCTCAKPLDGARQSVRQLLALAVEGRLDLPWSGLQCSGSPQLDHDALQLRDEYSHPLIATAHVVQLALGPLARGPLEVELATDLQGAALQLGEPYLQLPFSTSYSHLLGRRDLFVLGQLALDALQSLGQLTRMVLARPQTAGEPVDLGATVVLEARVTVLDLDSQLFGRRGRSPD